MVTIFINGVEVAMPISALLNVRGLAFKSADHYYIVVSDHTVEIDARSTGA